MIKIDIISGFLGAGKTTLIKKLLQEALQDTKVVLIENEFGEIGVDGGFLKDAGIEMKEMNSGCICCSLVGDFGTALKEVITTYEPDRILIEPSGVGKLSDVKKAIEDVSKELEVEISSAVAVVDGKKCKSYIKNFGEFFVNQVEHAGAIFLSRTDMLSEEKMQECISLLREHNESAVIVTTPWEQLEGKAMLETMEGTGKLEELAEELMQEECSHSHHHEEHHAEHCDHDHHCDEHHHDHHHVECHDHHHVECHDEHCSCHNHAEHHHADHHADEVFTSWGFETPRSYEKSEVTDILSKLDSGEYGTVLRSKGMLQTQSKEWIYFDYVPKEHDIRWGSPEVTGKVCVIGSELAEDKLAELFHRK